jgi:hypothetical protein
MKRNLGLIFLAFFWISVSEFFRNEFLLKQQWEEHYRSFGMNFPSDPENGAIWGIWSLCFSIVIYIISSKFSFFQTVLLSWTIGFILMWLVIGNLGVLPWAILPFAVPLSILEVWIAVLILSKADHK